MICKAALSALIFSGTAVQAASLLDPRPVEPVDVIAFSLFNVPVPACEDRAALASLNQAVSKEDWGQVSGWAEKGDCIFVNGASWGQTEAASVSDGLMLSVKFAYAEVVDPVTEVLEKQRDIGPLWVDTMQLRTLMSQKPVHDMARAPFESK